MSSLDDVLKGYVEKGRGYADVLSDVKSGQLGSITAEILLNKDYVRRYFAEGGAEGRGEYYTPKIVCQKGREYLKGIGRLKGEVVWDCCCGTGNLMSESGYPAEKVYESTLDTEDVDLLQSTGHKNAFRLDFLQGMDYAKGLGAFSSQLPDSLKAEFLSRSPITFYINPPYVQGNGGDMGVMLAKRGMQNSAKDLTLCFLERVLLLVQEYGLRDVVVGFYSAPTSVTDMRDFWGMFMQYADYLGGFAFDGTLFTGVSKERSWHALFSMFRVRFLPQELKKPSVFQYDVLSAGMVKEGVSTREFFTGREGFTSWMQGCVGQGPLAPKLTSADLSQLNMDEIHSHSSGVIEGGDSVLGYLRCSNVDRVALSFDFISLYGTDRLCIPVRYDNFDRVAFCVAYTYVVKRSAQRDALSKCLAPEAVPDWWLASAMVYFLFCPLLKVSPVHDSGVDIGNSFYPFEQGMLQGYAFSPKAVVLNNDFVLHRLAKGRKVCLREAEALYSFCRGLMIETLPRRKGMLRAHPCFAYEDADWRSIFLLLNKEEKKAYYALVRSLRDALLPVAESFRVEPLYPVSVPSSDTTC